MSVIYTTYDLNLKEYLKEYGIRYLICGQSVTKPHNMFWVYERNEKFNAILNNWIYKNKS